MSREFKEGDRVRAFGWNGVVELLEEKDRIITKLKEALGYYANTDNWVWEYNTERNTSIERSDIYFCNSDYHGGKRARQVLKEIEEGK